MIFPNDIVRLVRLLLWKSRVVDNNNEYHTKYISDEYHDNIRMVFQALNFNTGDNEDVAFNYRDDSIYNEYIYHIRSPTNHKLPKKY